MSTDVREREKKLAKLQIILGMMKKHNISLSDEETKWRYTQTAGGGTTIHKKKLRRSVRKDKKVIHVKVCENISGNKDYQICFKNKTKDDLR